MGRQGTIREHGGMRSGMTEAAWGSKRPPLVAPGEAGIQASILGDAARPYARTVSPCEGCPQPTGNVFRLRLPSKAKGKPAVLARHPQLHAYAADATFEIPGLHAWANLHPRSAGS